MTKIHKYNAKSVVVNNIKFDSKAEASAYEALITAGLEVKLQEVFTIQPAFTDNRIKIRPIQYKSDFSVLSKNKKVSYILDIKGFITQEFKLKKKMMLFNGNRIICVSTKVDLATFIAEALKNTPAYDLEVLLTSTVKTRRKEKKVKKLLNAVKKSEI